MKLKKLGAIFDFILRRSGDLGDIAVVFMMASICVIVFIRYAFRHSIIWPMEISEYLLLLITFICAAWVQKIDLHVKVDILLTKFSPKFRLWLDIITSSISTITFIAITWFGAKVTWAMYQAGYTLPKPLRPPQFILTLIVSVGSLLLAIQLARMVYNKLHSWSAAKEKQVEINQGTERINLPKAGGEL